ncbi:RiPP maturation protein ApyI [Rhizobium ruizarguesonis]|uniref:RiPP maturation protein ApyI n=1 Tax=Rhizobium ruizarguesonis TaxID=2081791 RepID=UPI00103059D3|nr:hypothetical protein [Rhizobium ruizarguesonis]TAY81979.1 hypothetical protein ELH86_24855 [Rhizobium ruizarguesonis]
MEPKHNSAQRVHAAAAALLADPALLVRCLSDPTVFEKEGFCGGEFDLDKMRLFAGLATKVRHNDLRVKIPCSFMLLDRLKLSIPLFASYSVAAAALRASGKNAVLDKIEAFGDFLSTWIDPKNLEHRLAWDMFRHEHNRLILASASFADASSSCGSKCPRPVGMVRHNAFSCNPLELEIAVRRGGSFKKIRRGGIHYLYQRRDIESGIRIFAVDPLAAVIVSLADGRRGISEITLALKGAGLPVVADQMRASVATLIHMQILTE